MKARARACRVTVHGPIRAQSPSRIVSASARSRENAPSPARHRVAYSVSPMPAEAPDNTNGTARPRSRTSARPAPAERAPERGGEHDEPVQLGERGERKTDVPETRAGREEAPRAQGEAERAEGIGVPLPGPLPEDQRTESVPEALRRRSAALSQGADHGVPRPEVCGHDQRFERDERAEAGELGYAARRGEHQLGHRRIDRQDLRVVDAKPRLVEERARYPEVRRVGRGKGEGGPRSHRPDQAPFVNVSKDVLRESGREQDERPAREESQPERPPDRGAVEGRKPSSEREPGHGGHGQGDKE